MVSAQFPNRINIRSMKIEITNSNHFKFKALSEGNSSCGQPWGLDQEAIVFLFFLHITSLSLPFQIT